MKEPSILYVGNILSRHGNTPTFIEALAPKLNELFPTVTSSDKKSKGLRLFDMVFTFLKYRKSIRVVIIDTYSTLNFFYAIILGNLALLFSKKYIPILRGGDLPQLLRKHGFFTIRFFTKAYRLVAPSSYLVTEFQKRGYEVEYVPNFIELENYPRQARERMGYKLCWVRAYQDVYNPLLAIEILRELRARGKGASLVMIGPDKGLRGESETLVAKYNLQSAVEFHGKLSKKEWVACANKCDILINTTNFDNRPVTILEAMAAGIPIVSTNVGGLPDLLQDGVHALMVPPNQIDPFILAIEALQDVALMRTLTNQAREKAEAFSWKNVKSQWVKLLGDAL